jgi:hypothetical protein
VAGLDDQWTAVGTGVANRDQRRAPTTPLSPMSCRLGRGAKRQPWFGEAQMPFSPTPRRFIHVTVDEKTVESTLVGDCESAGTGDIVDAYMATGGTLTITSLTPTITGKVSNATFTHVTIDEKSAESTPVGDCDSAVTGDYTFSQTATELTE